MAEHSPDSPLQRPVDVSELPPEGLDVVVTATEQERAALARDFGLPSVEALEGRFHLVRKSAGVTVTGTISASVHQTCVVTLDPFPATVEEPVEAKFSAAVPVSPPASAGREHQTELDVPEPLVGDRIDLGALTAEFLALGLDPYPRKPGATFAFADAPADEASPFAALVALKPKKGPEGGAEG